jgi:membrane protease YdiL (CAAX protease family)
MLEQTQESLKRTASGPWTDLGLTLPIFIGYHVGVVFLPVRNAADWVTQELVVLVNYNHLHYWGLTAAIAGLYVGCLFLLGRDQALRPSRFLWIFLEGVAYAVAMKLLATAAVGQLSLGPSVLGAEKSPVFVGVVMSLGAGFYEEVMFRVVLFGVGSKIFRGLFPFPVPFRRFLLSVFWAFACAALFSFWHHLGPYGEPFAWTPFLFRWVCGLVFTVIFVFRGFAPAVWTHTLYDLWVLVL